jgi:hypothetical protein|nr:MAG TPA: major capsid protein [Caudoviricetes sp.]
MANLTYTQIAPLLTKMYNQYTGRTSAQYLTFGQMQNTFKMGFDKEDDNLYQIIPTVLAKSIYAIRPYSRKFSGMVWDNQRYGNYIRKFTPIVNESEVDNDEWNINVELAKEEASQDWKSGTKPVKYDVLLTIASGGQSFARKYTIYKNQINAAFDSEAGVASYFSMLMTEFSNIYEIDLENRSRAQLANLAIILADAGKATPTIGNMCKKEQVFHALTKYNAETGLAMTAKTIMNPADFRPFMIWLSAEMKTLKENLAVRGTRFHGDFNGKVVNRHTEAADLRFYLVSKFGNYFEANGSEFFHPEKAELGDYEKVTFWTDPSNPMQIKGDAEGVKIDGVTKFTLSNQIVDNVLGIMMDIDTLGIVPIDQWSALEPLNARFGFRNGWNHYTFKTPVDFTENAILILLD